MMAMQNVHVRWIVPTIVSLGLSFLFSIPLVPQQEEEGVRPNCVQVGPFEDQIKATLSNRIDQLESALGFSKMQKRKLSVAAKGILRRQADYDEGWFFYGNPM